MTTKDYDKLLIEDIKDILLSDYPLSLREQLLDDILEDYIPLLSNENSRIQDHIKLQEIESTVFKMSQDNFVKFNEWLDSCPYGNYITNKLDYNPKTKYWEFRVKVPGISKQLRDSYTDTTSQFYTN